MRTGGTVQLLNNGVTFFPALVKDLHAAQRTIPLLRLHLGARAGERSGLHAALIERARAG